MMLAWAPALAPGARGESVPTIGGARAIRRRFRPPILERDTVMMPNARDSRHPQPSVRFSRPIVPFEAFSGDHPSFHARLTELEQMTTDIRERIAHVEAGFHHLATKNDVTILESTLLKWFIGTAIALTSFAFTAARLFN